ncbi:MULTISPECIES: hypothetical protein [unclassified Streptomyces]|uniref:hypothetical protein n=1 Tax=unclassified Streptomyces TaxID=2593676 RepID=UPI00382E2AE4
MPRGRHRHSPPLHKLLPPTAVAGAAVLCAAGAWFLAEPVVLRGLVAVAAAAAVTGAGFMRGWDREAGRRVAELTRARESDGWKAEERIAELEADVEESRELRLKLEAKLRAKRIELAGLRGEHAALLRRYATAETERATALEGRRRLALEAAAEPKALPAGGTPGKAAYVSAARALDELPRNAAVQQAKRTVEAARARDLAERATEAGESRGKHAAGAGAEQHSRPSSALPATRVPTASAIVPYAPVDRSARRPEGGFDFFGAQAAAQNARDGLRKAAADDTDDTDELPPAAELARVAREDLADVVGEEALAERRRAEERGIGQVIDLTAHDETEPLELGELRNAISG